MHIFDCSEAFDAFTKFTVNKDFVTLTSTLSRNEMVIYATLNIFVFLEHCNRESSGVGGLNVPIVNKSET